MEVSCSRSLLKGMKLADSFQHPHFWNSLQHNIRAKAAFSPSCLQLGNEQGIGILKPSIPALCMAPLMSNPCSWPPQTFCLQCRLRLFLANPPPFILSFHLLLLSLLLLLILHTLSFYNFPALLLHLGLFLQKDQSWHCQHYYSLYFTVDEVGFQER